MRRKRGSQEIVRRRREKRKAKKLEEAKLEEDTILNSYTIHIPKPEFTPKPPKRVTRTGRILNWIKEHVRPDIGLTPFPEGEAPNKNDDFQSISDKLRENLKVGIKITWKF